LARVSSPFCEPEERPAADREPELELRLDEDLPDELAFLLDPDLAPPAERPFDLGLVAAELLLPRDADLPLRPAEPLLVDGDLADERDAFALPADLDAAPERFASVPADFVDELPLDEEPDFDDDVPLFDFPPSPDDPLFALPAVRDDDLLFAPPVDRDDEDLLDDDPAPRDDPLFDEADLDDDEPDFALFDDPDFDDELLLPPLFPVDEVLVGIVFSPC
jgi:hypothetical protein